MNRAVEWLKKNFAWVLPALLWAAPLLFLGVFFFWPLAKIFGAAVAWLQGAGLQISREAVLRPLGFTVWQAALSTLLTMALGLPGAFVLGRYTFRGKKLLTVLTTIPFILPTVVAAAGFNALLGPRGWVNVILMQVLGLEQPPIAFLNTIAAIVLAHVFYNTTVVLQLVGNAWAQLDPRLEQAARCLGASPRRVLFEVTLPLLRPAILAAGLLVFLFDFTSFGVVLLLGGPKFATLEVEIYIQALHRLNLPLAGVLSAIQLACTLLLTGLYGVLSRGRVTPLMPRLKGEGLRQARRGWERVWVTGMVTLLMLLLLSPLAALVARSITRLDADRGERGAIQAGVTLAYYRELFVNRRQSFFYVSPAKAALNSLEYGLETVGIALGLGFLAVYAQGSGGRLSRVLDGVLMLPLGASAVTLGLGYVMVFNRPPLEVRTFPLLIPIAHSLVALPFVVRTLRPALAAIPLSLKQAAAVLGATPWRVWWEVELPILARAVTSSAVFAFTISLGEFGATAFLARPEKPTLPVAIFRFLSQPGALNYGQALAMATLLMGVCALSVALMQALERK
ncbi:MAG: iron ABC transporter permease [Anaerolinea sp.]|nr:iron ABC transporter permease [Anaerolinea sp.]